MKFIQKIIILQHIVLCHLRGRRGLHLYRIKGQSFIHITHFFVGCLSFLVALGITLLLMIRFLSIYTSLFC